MNNFDFNLVWLIKQVTLALRSQRREIDHVLDTVNDELLHEEKVIAEAKRILAVVSSFFRKTFIQL